MNHQPIDITGKIMTLYKNHDKHSIAYLLNKTSVMLNGHIYGAVAQF